MNRELINNILNNSGADALLITSHSNTLYYGGYDNPECTILVTKEDVFYFTDDRYTLEAKCYIPDYFRLVSLACSDLNTISAYAVERGVRILGTETISFADYQVLSSNFAEIKDCQSIISSPRMIKTDEEIAIIQSACSFNDKAFNALLPQIKEGMTELELAYLLQYEYIKAGGEGIAFDTISVFGEHTAYPHGHPGHTKLKYGDVITLDFGTKYKGYCSDITRSFSFGTPSDPDYVKIYNDVLEANKLGISIVKEGMACIDADRIVREFLDSKGLGKYFTHSLGHGVGIDIHERPFLNRRSKDVFCNNQIYTIEPGVYIAGKFGIRIEDSLYLTNGNPVTLTRCDKNLIIL